MQLFEFTAQKITQHDKRIGRALIVNALVAVAFFLIAMLMSNWQIALGLAIVVFVVQYFKASRWEHYFITKIKIGETIDIFYKDRGVDKHITDSKSNFEFKKQVAFNRTRTVYLAVFYKESLLLKQFESEEWNETIFDTLIQHSKQ